MTAIKRLCCGASLMVFVSLVSSCAQPNSPHKKDPLALNDVRESMYYVKKTNGAIYQQGSDGYLYGSSRAHRVGDLLTVHVDENLNAQDNITSNTSRTSTLKDSLALTSVVKPGALEINGANVYAGSGKSQQSNVITGDITVTVIRVMTNGNLVIRGYKTLTLTNGIEKIGIAGIVRQIDINSADNSVLSSKIADAHIAYLGHGDLTRSAHKGWLTRIFGGSIWPV